MSVTFAQVLAANPGLPAPPDGRTGFAEPWQATVFALTVHLADRGVFTWARWADALGHRLRSQPATTGDATDDPAADKTGDTTGDRAGDTTGDRAGDTAGTDATSYDAAGYFEAWEAALSDLLTQLGLVEPGVIDRTERAWHAAAAHTPHGRPIELAPNPLSPPLTGH